MNNLISLPKINNGENQDVKPWFEAYSFDTDISLLDYNDLSRLLLELERVDIIFLQHNKELKKLFIYLNREINKNYCSSNEFSLSRFLKYILLDIRSYLFKK